MGFAISFLVAIALHYGRLTNEAGIGEWLPSMLIAIGQYFPERTLFQIVAAMASSFHIGMVLIWYFLTRPQAPRTRSKKHFSLDDIDDSLFNERFPDLILVVGILRTIFLAGIIYIPTPDDHDTHDFCLAGYLLMTASWFYGMLKFTSGDEQMAESELTKLSAEMDDILGNFDIEDNGESVLPLHYDGVHLTSRGGDKSRSENNGKSATEMEEDDGEEKEELAEIKNRKRRETIGYRTRKRIAWIYALMIIPLVHYMIQRRVYRVPGSFSKYAFFEWITIVLDISFDAVSTVEFEGLELRVVSASENLREERAGEDEDVSLARDEKRDLGLYENNGNYV